MKRLKRIIICILVSVILFLTGCSYTQTGIDALLQPPKLSKQQDEIYSALNITGKKDLKLKYPRKGDYKSAFVIQNIDEEESEEAILFYEDTTAKERPLQVVVLDQEDGRWVMKNKITEDASEVEKVSFITTDEKRYVVIGYTSLSKTEKFVRVYHYQDNKLASIGEVLRCSNYEVFDINGDGEDEVIAMIMKKSDRDVQVVTAGAFKLSIVGLTMISETNMDPNTTDFDNIYKGKIDAKTPALYVDGRKGSTKVTTEILIMSKGKLTNLIYNANPKKSIIAQTERTIGSYCEDLNNDGIYEIPVVVTALGYENAEAHQKLSFTDWYNYKNGELVLYKTSYVDYKLGYLYNIPQKWENKVTLGYSSKDNEVFFYEYDSSEKEQTKKLASIKVVEKTAYADDMENARYRILKENGLLLYLYQIYPSQSELALSEEDFTRGFALL